MRTRSTSTDALSVVSPLQETVDTTDWELKTSLDRSGLLRLGRVDAGGLSRLGFSANFSGHCDGSWWVLLRVVVEARGKCSGGRDEGNGEGGWLDHYGCLLKRAVCCHVFSFGPLMGSTVNRPPAQTNVNIVT